ncbi:hypothetical protein GOP47_0012529 [Adiantum capillus-veneris]|uniref:Uncharacterized protein n=1 Tax=Adiantum capillus-veneris TaxID=13818 RepID=A0A9D4US84_ADICA|nr:hypothetical protein GOP47_0012529 [Adiantum capillus-veneris]
MDSVHRCEVWKLLRIVQVLFAEGMLWLPFDTLVDIPRGGATTSGWSHPRPIAVASLPSSKVAASLIACRTSGVAGAIPKARAEFFA